MAGRPTCTTPPDGTKEWRLDDVLTDQMADAAFSALDTAPTIPRRQALLTEDGVR